MFQYFEKVVRGTDHEDTLVILQFLKGMIGQKFSFLNYYKEIPVSYDAELLGVENEMAEFSIHEYQAKIIALERKALIYSHPKSPVREDIFGDAFYVSSSKKRVILSKLAYAHIKSDKRRFVRVMLDSPVEADLLLEDDMIKGNIKDISLGGAAMNIMSRDLLVQGDDIKLVLRIPSNTAHGVAEIGLSASIVKLTGDCAPYSCVLEFHSEKHSQQQIAYYINQRQVEIIKELKDLSA